MNFNNHIATTCTFTFLLMMHISVADARSKTYPLIINGSGAFISTTIDTNNDGSLATISMLEGKSRRFGRVTAKIMTEAKLALDFDGNPVTCATPDGKPGIINELVQARGIYTFKRGGQLFTEAVSVQTCADIEACFGEQGSVKEGCIFYGLAKGKITGGTGRFACASGDFEDTSTGFALVVDPKNQFFGSILESNVNGTITIDRNCNN